MRPEPQAVTGLLRRWREGDKDALDQLMPLVYDELRRLAGHYLRDESEGHTLQATELVNEAYLRLVDLEVPWQDRAHFFAISARLLRRILVDHAKSRGRAKRGGGQRPLPLDEALAATPESNPAILALDDALEGLARLDARKGRIVELHYFGGMTYDEMAEALGVSAAAVHRELRLAKAWLYEEMSREAADDA